MNQSGKSQSGLRQELIVILFAATVLFAFNAWEHNPALIPNHYTDVSSIFFREGIGTGRHGVPYVDYVFEYPAMVGFFVYFTSLLARASSADFVVSLVRYKLMMDGVLYVFVLVAVYGLYRLTDLVALEKKRIWQLLFVMPSFLMFLTYNFDIIAIAFSLLAIFAFMRGRHSESALLLGLGVSSKLYPAILLPALLAPLPNWNARLRYVALAAIAFLAVNAPFIVVGFGTWLGTWTYLAAWGIENSWLIFIFPQLDQRAHYVGLAVLLYVVYKVMAQTMKDQSSSNDLLLKRCLLLNLGWLLGSYIVTPQMALIVLPFYVLVPTIPIVAAYAADTLNAMIIVLWFVVMNAGGNPLAADNPIQWIALGRQLIWFGLLVHGLYPRLTDRLVRKLLMPIRNEQ
jgi:uncharacterized membrane protein